MSFSKLSTGTKFASKPQKIQKSVCFKFSTCTKSSKTAQKFFQKTVKMYLVAAINLKIKKNFKVGSRYYIRGIPVFNLENVGFSQFSKFTHLLLINLKKCNLLKYLWCLYTKYIWHFL